MSSIKSSVGNSSGAFVLILWLKAGCCYRRPPVFCSQAAEHEMAGAEAPTDEKPALGGVLIDF